MKLKALIISFIFTAGGPAAAAFALDAQPAKAQPGTEANAAPAAIAVKAAAPAPEKKVIPAVKAAKKPAVKQAAPEAAALQKPEQQLSTAAAAAQARQIDMATAAPVAVSAPVKPEPAVHSSCPYCFEPLLAGYNGIIADLKPWMQEMDLQAAAFDQKLSAIQKQIDGKDDGIAKAKLDPDKKAGKAAAKALSKERKQLLNEYSDERDAKDKFYKKFSKDVEKKMKGYNRIVEEKLRTTLSAASD